MANAGDRLFPVGPASHWIGLSETRTRQLADSGELESFRDAGGRRLITERSLNKLRARRARQAKAVPEPVTASAG